MITPDEFYKGKELRLQFCFNDVTVTFKISGEVNETGDVFNICLTGPMKDRLRLELKAEDGVPLTPTDVFDAATTLAQTAIPKLLEKCSMEKAI